MQTHLSYLIAGLLALLPSIFHRSNPAVAAERKVVIGYVARDFNNFPPLLAEAKGYFREAGIAPQLVQVRSTVALPGILGGAASTTSPPSAAASAGPSRARP
jgi:ABC-type nitrate/sulfonate/bicarbonate transport system substrate-binding protein